MSAPPNVLKRLIAATERVVEEREIHDEHSARLFNVVSLLFGRLVKRNDGVIARKYSSPEEEVPARKDLATALMMASTVLMGRKNLNERVSEDIAIILMGLAGLIDPTQPIRKLMSKGFPIERTLQFKRGRAHPNPWADWQIATEVDNLIEAKTPKLEAYRTVGKRHNLDPDHVGRIYRKAEKGAGPR